MISIRLLGKFQLQKDQHFVDLTLPKQRCLAYLALHEIKRGQAIDPLSLEEVARALGRQDVKHVLFRLRQKLGDGILPPHTNTLIRLDDANVDLATLYSAIRRLHDCIDKGEDGMRRRAELFVSLLTSYPDELLAEWNDRWVQSERKAVDDEVWSNWDRLDLRALCLRRDVRIVGDRLIKSLVGATESGKHRSRQTYERLLRHLLHELGKIRRFGEAEGIYLELTNQLVAMGSKPALSTTSLTQDTRRAMRAFEATPFRGHVIEGPAFQVERNKEIAELLAALDSKRLVTLWGGPGIGKTTLVAQVCRHLSETFPDRLWFFNLAHLQTNSSESEVGYSISQSLGLQDATRGDALVKIISNLSRRQMLLIFDASEFCLNGCARLIQRILHNCPRVRILTTSRLQLSLAEEHVYAVPRLPLPENVQNIQQWMNNQSVQIFLGHWSGRPPYDEATRKIIAEICRLCDGLPLLLELTAKRSQPLQTTLESMRRGDELELRMEAAIDTSFALLSEAQQDLLLVFSVFDDGATQEAIKNVYASHWAAARVTESLDTLVRSSLMQWHPKTERYRVLDRVHEFAYRRLSAVGRTEAIRAAHLNYFISACQSMYQAILGKSQTVYLTLLRRERRNIEAALRHARTSDPGLGLILCSWNWRFWLLDNSLTEGRRLLREFLDLAPEASIEVRARSHIGLATLAFYQSDFAESNRCATEALPLAQALRDHWLQNTALVLQGMYNFHEKTDVARGLSEIDRAVQIAEEAHDEWLVVLTKINSAFNRVIAQVRGLRQLTLVEVQELPFLIDLCIRKAEQVGGEWLRATVYVNAGEISRWQVTQKGDRGSSPNAAVSYFRKALEIWAQLGHKYGIIQSVYKLAAVLIATRDISSHERAALLLGFDHMLTTGEEQIPVPKHDRLDLDRTLHQTRQSLGEQRFLDLFERGAAISYENGLRLALTSKL